MSAESHCSACNASLAEDAKFCTQCGAAVISKGRTIVPAPPGFMPETREIIPVPPGFESGPSAVSGTPTEGVTRDDRPLPSQRSDIAVAIGAAQPDPAHPPHPDEAGGARAVSPMPPGWTSSTTTAPTASSTASTPTSEVGDAVGSGGRRHYSSRASGWISRLAANPGAVIVGIPLIVMSVLFVWKVVLNQSAAGASSPEAVVSRLVDGARQQDVLGLANAVAPSESMNLADIAETTFDSLNSADSANPAATNVAIDLNSVDVDRVNDSVALVTVDFRATITSDSSWFRAVNGTTTNRYQFTSDDVLATLNDRFASSDNRMDSLTLVAVKEKGGWFWSPTLTSVAYLDAYSSAIEADWGAVERLPEATANSPSQAMDNAIAAIGNFDVQALAASTDLATSRALMVIEEGLQTALDEPDFRTTRVDLEASYEPTGAGLELNHLDVSVSDNVDSTSASVSGWCIRTDGSDATTCLDYAWLSPMDANPMIETADDRGGVVLDVFATIRHQANLVSANASLNRILGIIDYPWLAQRLPTTPGSTATVDFGDEPFALLAVPVTAGQIPSISFDAANSTRYMFERSDGTRTVDRRADESGTWLLAVYAEGAFCARTLCDWEPDGEATVQVDNAFIQTLETSTSADAELTPGGAYVFEIPIPEGTTEIDITIDGNVTSSVGNAEPGLVSGMGHQTQWTIDVDGDTTYYLSVANPGIDTEKLHVEVRAK